MEVLAEVFVVCGEVGAPDVAFAGVGLSVGMGVGMGMGAEGPVEALKFGSGAAERRIMAGEHIDLTTREFKILSGIARRSGRVCTTEKLMSTAGGG